MPEVGITVKDEIKPDELDPHFFMPNFIRPIPDAEFDADLEDEIGGEYDISKDVSLKTVYILLGALFGPWNAAWALLGLEHGPGVVQLRSHEKISEPGVQNSSKSSRGIITGERFSRWQRASFPYWYESCQTPWPGDQ